MTHREKKSYTLGISAILLWSTVATAFKVGLKELSLVDLILGASFFSFIALFITLLITKKVKDITLLSQKEWSLTLVSGLINPTLYYFILFKSYSLLPAQIAQPLNYTWPLALTLLSALFFKEKIHMKEGLTFLICLLGIIVLSQGGGAKANQTIDHFGIFLGLLSALVWAIYWIININNQNYKEVKLFIAFFEAFLILLIYKLIFKESFSYSLKGLLSMLYIGFFEMGFTFLLWSLALNYASKRGHLAQLAYLSPIFSLFWIHFLLGEPIYLTTLLGLGLIILGIILNSKRD